MPYLSRPVSSTQTGIHPLLQTTVARHLAHPFCRPYAQHNLNAYQALRHAWGERAPLILDAGCGVGASTLLLAQQHPDHFVVGIDKSQHRLSRGKNAPLTDNVLFIRADLVDLWRLMADDGVRLAQHWLLYPNPWPKPQHLQRRWHGHAVFPQLLHLGGRLELRTNWQPYACEFATALQQATGNTCQVECWQATQPVSRFEQKYQSSSHGLWRVATTLPPAPAKRDSSG